jgi:hypothetical protein
MSARLGLVRHFTIRQSKDECLARHTRCPGYQIKLPQARLPGYRLNATASGQNASTQWQGHMVTGAEYEVTAGDSAKNV